MVKCAWEEFSRWGLGGNYGLSQRQVVMDGQQTKAVHQIEVRDVNGTPDGREPIRWKLVTNLPVACKAETGLQTLRVTVLEPTLVSNKPWSPTVANHY